MASSSSSNCSLPRCETIKWDPEAEETKIVSAIVEEYDSLAAEIGEIVFNFQDSFNPANTNTLHVDDGRMRELISKSIGVNYDITEEELLALQVLRSDTYAPIFEALIDKLIRHYQLILW